MPPDAVVTVVSVISRWPPLSDEVAKYVQYVYESTRIFHRDKLKAVNLQIYT